MAILAATLLVAGELAARLATHPVLLNTLTFDGSNDAYRLHRWVGGKLGYELIPGVAFGDVRVSSLGIRDEERPIAKAAGVKRILVVGDSVTIGAGMKLEETYPKVLESTLNRTGMGRGEGNTGGARYEVWNCGVIGYNARQEAEWLLMRGMRFDPDLVLVGFCPNDFGAAEVQKLEGGRWQIEYFEEPAVPVVFEIGRGGADVMLAHSYFARLLFDLAWKATDKLGRGAAAVRWFNPTTRENEQAYHEMAAACRRKSVGIAIAIIPYLDDSRGYPFEREHARLKAVASAAGLPVIDLTEELEARGLASLRLSADDPWHPGPLGHKLIAEGIEIGLRDGGLLR